jgi:hypothetical protein
MPLFGSSFLWLKHHRRSALFCLFLLAGLCTLVWFGSDFVAYAQRRATVRHAESNPKSKTTKPPKRSAGKMRSPLPQQRIALHPTVQYLEIPGREQKPSVKPRLKSWSVNGNAPPLISVKNVRKKRNTSALTARICRKTPPRCQVGHGRH